MTSADILARLESLFLDRVDETLRSEVRELLSSFVAIAGEQEAATARKLIDLGLDREAVAMMGMTLKARVLAYPRRLLHHTSIR